MSRALTVYSRREAAQQLDLTEVERVMASQGCSEPVAKNLLKYAKLGIGPLAAPGTRDEDERVDLSRPSGSSRDAFPPRLDRKAAAALAEQKLRERQEQEELLELSRRKPQKKAGLSSLGPVMAREDEVEPMASKAAGKTQDAADKAQDEDHLAIFEARPGRPSAKKPMQIGGISRLGPVMARQDDVDPLEREAEAAKAADEEEEEDEEEKGQEEYRQFMEKKRKQEEDRKRQNQQVGKKGKKRRRGDRDDQSSEEDFEDEAQGSFGHQREQRGRSPSPGGSGGQGLMSEKQIMALMGKERKTQGKQRGSVRAQSRIQKEREEWERAKANNPEFWKAPQFALCYSAETGKKARGAG